MLIATEEEKISLPVANGEEVVKMKSPLMESNLGSINGMPEASEESPATSIDVNVVPEDDKHKLEQRIFTLEGEIVNLRLKQRSLDERRREALNKIIDIKGCIRLFCRVRPCLPTDKRRNHQPLSVESERIVVRSGSSRKEFGFDKVFPQESSQEDVFVEVEPILRSALDGHNVCILAYGQTGTGKTYTMDGTSEAPGIIPRVLEELFRQASLDGSTDYTFSISMLEVYLGNLRDLLAPRPSSRVYAASRCILNIQTDSKGSVDIDGLTEVQISNFTKANWWYNKGRRVRSTSWTNVNEASSRSHCLTRITIYRPRDAQVTKLWMIDLGGSERLLKTGATGQTLDEGRAINLSLSALGDVIAALRRKKGHVPYRNSKLTQILKDSLGNGSKVLMLVHVSPYEDDIVETVCSFSFAKRARAVECNRDLSEESKKKKEKRIAELEEQMMEVEEECENLRHQIENVQLLLNESKKTFSVYYELPEDGEKSPNSPEQQDFGEIMETPKASEKATRRSSANSMPRFMTSTMASRQRESAAERQIINSKPKSLRSWAKSSVQISGSHSISYSDPTSKHFLRNAHKKTGLGETNSIIPMEDMETKPRGKATAAASNPNSRVMVCHHRRRMSDCL
ncbi:PREDICTED: kinesin-like protein KIN-14U [Ipomoea nil]|uniref:kinesin-like protein KIN-14U n=1 Tax=Ipomoea nil TaxID=35883 RepID=UPI0009011B6D|nr:PREDICTED: kinesin-like protein KIN-14U [Ipomoea nil]